MKKALIVIVLMVGAVIVMSSVAMAQLDQKPIPISANVAKYAEITVMAQPMDFGSFTGGSLGEQRTRDNAIFSVETNTALDLRFSAGDLTLDTSYLETIYEAIDNGTGNSLGYFNRDAAYSPIDDPLTVANAQPAKTTKTYSVTGTARMGSTISSQEAGNYSATITLTVSAP